MPKKYFFGILTFVVLIALGALVYLCGQAEVHALSSEAHTLTQLQQGATPEVTLLNTVLQYVGQFLPTL